MPELGKLQLIYIPLRPTCKHDKGEVRLNRKSHCKSQKQQLANALFFCYLLMEYNTDVLNNNSTKAY